MDIDTIKNDLVSDAFDTCINDSSYLIAVLQTYFGTFSNEELRKMHDDAFNTGEAYD